MTSIHTIQTEVCRRFNLNPLEMVSHRRGAAVALPRQVAYYLCLTLTRHSLGAVGRHFGGRDHTTVLHGRRVIEERLRIDPELAAKVAEIERAIEEAA